MKVMILATSPKTKGGITTVVNAYKKSEMWEQYNCKWVVSHIDKNLFWKFLYLIKGWIQFIFLVPFCDIVHIHVSEPPSALRKCLFMPLAKLFGKKTIVHFHSFSPDTTIKSNRAYLYSYLFGKADIVIALSPYWKNEIALTFPNIPKEKIRVLYNPCTCELYPDNYQKKKIILFAGAIIARKGYEDLIRAFAIVVKKHPDWDLMIAGDGELSKAKSIVNELDITNHVKFVGWIRGKEKDRVFKEASIFCLPSYAEGFPMAVLDAWAYGLPVIATPVGGLPDIAEDNVNILLFNPSDIEKLVVCIEQLIIDEQLMKRLSLESQKLSATLFSIKEITEQLSSLYQELK